MAFSLNKKLEEGTFIIAEIGNNHNGSIDTAKQLVDIAAAAGADAVKIQTFTGQDIVTPKVLANEYQGWDVQGFTFWYEFLDTIALPLEAHAEVFAYAQSKGLLAFSTPTSPAIVDFLETLDVPLYKMASMDVTNVQLLKKVASTGKPVIISTGMADEEEIDRAVAILKNNELAILHCISDYPTLPENANLQAVTYLNERYGLASGLSDHSISNEFAIGSVVLGGKIVEKHITYSRAAKEKAEHHFALEPSELNSLVASIRIVEQGIGEQSIVRSEQEQTNKFKYRRSLHLNRDMKKGDQISAEDIAVLRPNIGAAPSEFDDFIGKTLSQDVAQWSGLLKEHLDI